MSTIPDFMTRNKRHHLASNPIWLVRIDEYWAIHVFLNIRSTYTTIVNLNLNL